MINPIVVIDNKQIIENSKDQLIVRDIPETLMNTMPRTVINTIPNQICKTVIVTNLPTVSISSPDKVVNTDEASDLDIRAMVIDIMIPDYQRLSEEEQFEENFILLY